MNNNSTVTLITLLIISALLAGGFWYFNHRTSKKEARTKNNSIIPELLEIGTSADFQPFSFKSEEGTITGFDIDVATEIAKRLGKKYALHDLPFDMLLPQLQLGTIHLVAAGLTPTPERAQRVIMTKPHQKGDHLVVLTLAKNPPLTGIKDLTGKNVIVNQGYTSDRYMSSITGPELTRLPTVSDALLALRSDRAYAFVTSENSLKPFFNQYSAQEFSTFIIPDAPEESSSLAISPQQPALAQEVQKILDSMEQDGTLRTLKEKWHLS